MGACDEKRESDANRACFQRKKTCPRLLAGLGQIAEPTGTDGLRYIGRTCHLSLLRSFSQAEVIFLSIDTQRLSKTIYFFICNAAQVQTHTGKYLFRSGRPFFLALNKASRSEKLQEIMVSHMKRSGVFFAQFVRKLADEFNLPHTFD